MHDQQNDPSLALTELRRRLAGGLARCRLDKTRLARKAGLGRTTVWEAFRAGKPVPSDRTVAALAHALKLPEDELLELRRSAAATSTSAAESGERPGRPIGEWEPHALEVHPAGPAPSGSGSGSPEQRVLPGYVLRAHDRVLADAVREAGAGRSRMVVVVGTSSTGKTRACWEAVQPLAEQGWRLWHPFDPTRAEAALEDLHRVGPRTVVWLNEAQHYLGDARTGERIAAAMHHLLIQPARGPVLVLSTLWPEYATRYTALPAPGGPDPHSQVRELLTGRTVSIPDTFDARALAAANTRAENGDQLLADALTRTRADGRLTQDLAGAPELLHRYQHATPAARAIVEAAMDARRLGVGLHLAQTFLTDAAADYLTDTDYDQLTDDWAEQAFAELARLVHGKQAPLRRAAPRPKRRPPGSPPPATASHPAGPVFRLADYLEQHGRITRSHLCPPASFWHAAHTHLTHPDDLAHLAQAAENRHRLQWAHHLRLRAADRSDTDVPVGLARVREKAGYREVMETFCRQTAAHADAHALIDGVRIWDEVGYQKGAETLARQAADHGHAHALTDLMRMRKETRNLVSTETPHRRAVELDVINGLLDLAWMRAEAGDLVGAETLCEHAASPGNADPQVDLAELRQVLTKFWPNGLDPDGMPTPPWQPSVPVLLDDMYRRTRRRGYSHLRLMRRFLQAPRPGSRSAE
ncbi:hypothetical protein ACH4GK_38485 [Streptomyces rimosus]|uniref:helix-turn-helix domain-containing protein n=1 Tax=Streptomyces rimosus TaxID=1927 RepID=UPI0007C4BB8D|nr:helix-turn-helix transcriptional regulator [Streptomyces rimosus]